MELWLIQNVFQCLNSFSRILPRCSIWHITSRHLLELLNRRCIYNNNINFMSNAGNLKIVWPLLSKESFNDDVDTVQMKNNVSHDSLSSFLGKPFLSSSFTGLKHCQTLFFIMEFISSMTLVLIFSSCQLFFCP